MPSFLADANYLVALGYSRDRNHLAAKQFTASTKLELLLPDVVLVEAMYNLERLGGLAASARFASSLVNLSPPLVPLTMPDFARAVEVLEEYQDANLDFVDCCLTALAERLEITKICTFDRRDFSIIRPKHINYFELLP